MKAKNFEDIHVFFVYYYKKTYINSNLEKKVEEIPEYRKIVT